MPPAEPRGPLWGAVLGLLCGLALSAGPLPLPLALVAGGALAFVLPGYGLGRAILPLHAFQPAERSALVLGASLALAIASALMLHLLPVGLSATSWGLLLGGFATGSCLVAWARAPRQAFARAAREGDAAWWPMPVGQLSVLAAAVLVTLFALLVARAGVTLQPRPGFTELWMLPAADGRGVSVGVAAHEGREQAYRLVVTLDGEVIGSIDDLTLADGASHLSSVALPPGPATLRKVEARLWRADDPAAADPYRLVRLSTRRVAVPASGSISEGSASSDQPAAAEAGTSGTALAGTSAAAEAGTSGAATAGTSAAAEAGTSGAPASQAARAGVEASRSLTRGVAAR